MCFLANSGHSNGQECCHCYDYPEQLALHRVEQSQKTDTCLEIRLIHCSIIVFIFVFGCYEQFRNIWDLAGKYT
jgi:hypothetical protein